MSKKGILFIQLGSPQSPTTPDVKTYLREFLSDPRVVDKQNLGWKLILNLFVLPSRSPKSAEAYRSIWMDPEGAPLVHYTEKFCEKIRENLQDSELEVGCSYILSSPRVSDVYGQLKEKGCTDIRVIPLFPQFCEATTLSCQDMLDKAVEDHGAVETLTFVKDFHLAPSYIEALARSVDYAGSNGDYEKLLVSFHGYPIRRIRGGDPYFDQCIATARALVAAQTAFKEEDILITFQSKFGREPWLEPATEATLVDLVENQGVKKIAVLCPAFTVDGLETLEEVGIGLREIWEEKGGECFHLIPCLNDDEQWCLDFSQEVVKEEGEEVARVDVSGCSFPAQPEQGCCHAAKHCETCPYKGMEKHPDGSLSPSDRGTMKALFVTLLLDLVGFAVIIPLFPKMLEYYHLNEAQGSLFQQLYQSIVDLSGNANSFATYALFGGALGGLYSLLQFLMAPVVGSISDRFGRRPVLLVSIFMSIIGYAMWIFSSSFALLLGSRILCGIAGSNISTANAAVADITNKKTRSKGMAIIGIAFGIGFTLGPALGAVCAIPDPTKWMSFPGVNPFSLAAFASFLLAVYNFKIVWTRFRETLPREKRGKGELTRTINPLKLISVRQFPGVATAIMINFIFLIAFGGAEQVLTFLCLERLGYDVADNGLMFTYIGIMLSLVQGGYVRRKAHDVGEKKMALRGLTLLIPAMLLIALAGWIAPVTPGLPPEGSFFSGLVLYAGLTFMVFGSAMTIPCVTALVSLYTPPQEQGRVLGIFRSLGALARALGPAIAGVLYWKYQYPAPYIFTAFVMLIPIAMCARLPKIPEGATADH